MTQTAGTWVVELTAHGPTDYNEWHDLADTVVSALAGSAVAVGGGSIDVTVHADAASPGAAVDDIVARFVATVGDRFTVTHIEVTSAAEFDRKLESPAVAAGR